MGPDKNNKKRGHKKAAALKFHETWFDPRNIGSGTYFWKRLLAVHETMM